MTIDRQDLEGSWTVLATGALASGIAVTPLGYRVKAGEILAGIDSAGRRHLLIPLMPGEAAHSSTSGRAVHISRINNEGIEYLSIFCLLSELNHVFTQFCRELTSSLEEATSPARAASEAFSRWKDLFSDAPKPRVLGESALIGLLGELLAVEQLLNLGASSQLQFWTGPLGTPHDLRAQARAIEVKSTLTREGRFVRVSSVDQLQSPEAGKLHMLHYQLESDPSGFNLHEIIERVQSAGAEVQVLATLLSNLGVQIDDLDPYQDRRYRVVGTRTYDVEGAAFPRILRSSFAGGNVPAGTLGLTYTIDLTNEPPSPLSEEAATAVLLEFVGGS